MIASQRLEPGMQIEQAADSGVGRSNSSDRVSLFGRLRYNFALFRMRLRSGHDGAERAAERRDEAERLAAEFERATGKRARDSVLVEIGFGARPERAMVYSAYFGQVHAIDLDAPVLRSRDLLGVARRNGWIRAMKSAVRHLLFDRRGWRDFHARAAEIIPGYAPQSVHFVVGNAGGAETWRTIPPPDLVVSTDVFEHIPEPALRDLLRMLRARAPADGLIITRPMVYTGISGGHDTAWYPHLVPNNRSDTAWGHLLDPDFTVDTYLNRLSRRGFRALFVEEGFVIERDEAELGDFGRQHMTEAKRARLSAWDDYELFSNQVTFWLRPAPV